MKSPNFYRFAVKLLQFDQTFIDFIISLVLVYIIFFASRSFAPFDTYPDGIIYEASFDVIKNRSIVDGYNIFRLTAGASEPISFLVFYIFGKFTNVAMANNLLNIPLALGLFQLLRKRSVNLWYWAPFVLTNYYILMLGFGALRLKIAFLFLAFSWLVQEKRIRWALLIGAVLSHYEMLIFIMISGINYLLTKRNDKVVRYAIVLLIALGFYQQQVILQKIQYYSSQYLFTVPYKLIAISIIMLILSDRFQIAVVSIAVFLSVALIIGDGRLNIIYFLMIVEEYLTNSRRTAPRQIVLFCCAGYLSVKGIQFIQSLLGGYSFFES